MEKKKIIIIICMLVICAVLIVGVLFLTNKDKKASTSTTPDNKIVSVLTIDVNPSIEINLNNDDKVVSVIALNEDSKELLKDQVFTDKKVNEVLDSIIDLLSKKDYLKGDTNLILVNVVSEKENLLNEVKENIEKVTKEKAISAQIVMQEVKVTDELKEIADKYNISISKAYYINEQLGDEENITIEDLKDVSLNEIKTKVEEAKKEETKDNTTSNQSQSSSENKGVARPKTSSCTPPSELKSTDWCTWNNQRHVGCEYYYDQELDLQYFTNKALEMIGTTFGPHLLGSYASDTAYSGASYCKAGIATITTRETRFVYYFDSVTGDYLTHTATPVPKFIWTEDEALQHGFEHLGLSQSDCRACWVSTGTEADGGPSMYYRYQANFDMNNGKHYSIDYNAVTGQIVSERQW